MNRKQRRLSKRNGNRVQKAEWNPFRDISIEARIKGLNIDQWDNVFQNNKFIVFVSNNIERKGRKYTRVMVRRSDSKAIYSWQDLFKIKNELFGEETEAIQFFPPKSELVDSANLYWFWIEVKNEL